VRVGIINDILQIFTYYCIEKALLSENITSNSILMTILNVKQSNCTI